MHSPKITQYSPKNQKTDFEFYALCKGLNSGKPLDEPCPNCFVISCRSAEEKEFYRSLLFGLWQSKAFHQFLIGSVIPFIRIGIFKNFFVEQARHLQQKEKAYKADLKRFSLLEQKEKQMREQLQLISELKRIYIARHLKR